MSFSRMHSKPLRSASGDGSGAGGDGPSSNVVPSWLLKAKVLVPELPAGYVHRASLLKRVEGLLERRLTVLQAPAGFGKTTALTDLARGAKEQGLVVAWISLDDDDMPRMFGSYLAGAFEHAGLDLSLLNTQDAWSESPTVNQIGMLARAIELHEAPCLLVLDEVDRLPRPTVELLDRLLKHGPRNLHVAMAFRSDPGLDLATHILDGGAIAVGAGQFRFSTDEIARFFGGELSRRELAAVEERTAGWPVALMVYRNMQADEAGGLGANTALLSENYVGVRLLRDLSAEDRAILFDLAVFDWLDADLVDKVLGSSDARLRIAALSSLDGLLSPLDSDRTVGRLHPLVRDYCLERLAVEDPARKRSLHQRIALAMADRGQLTPAWRHASAAGENRLVGEIVERVGIFELWLRKGVMPLISANRFLTPEITASHPRLELLRCIILHLSSRFAEANALCEAVARKTDGFTRDGEGGDTEALAVDWIFTQAVLAGGTGQALHDEIAALPPISPAAAGGDERTRFIVNSRHTLLCIDCYERSLFEESRRHGVQAQAHSGEDVRYGDVLVDIYLGMSAMAQGRVQDASDSYRRARQVTREFFSSDPCLAASADVLTLELDLERNRVQAIRRRSLKSLTEMRDIWVDIYAAAIAVSAELTFEQYDNEAVIQLLAKAVDNVRATGIETLSNTLSALLVFYLVEVGRPGEAGQVWRDHGLPCGAAELLDLDRQSWRTMEALSCARVRLLAEQGEFAAAGEIASRLCSVASEHGLTRTELRGLALSMVVAHRAGQTEQALVRVVEFLRLARDVDYVRPLVRSREVSRVVLRRLLAASPEADMRDAAESMLAQLDQKTLTAPAFSPRELQVLVEVSHGLRNREIAGSLGISEAGVRFHLKNIYRKTGTSRRADAVRNAQSLGVLDQPPRSTPASEPRSTAQ